MMDNTQLATKKIRLEQWARIIQDRNSSGMTIDQYCDARGLSRNAYYYWLRKLKHAALEVVNSESKDVEFVELKAPSVRQASDTQQTGAKAFHTEAMITCGAFSISVNSATSKELLRNLVEVVSRVE